jgi:hypothetical protein
MKKPLVAAALLFCACGGNNSPDLPFDGGTDGGHDGGIDGGTDGGIDGGTDGGVDGGTDAGIDGGLDGGIDGGTDGGVHESVATFSLTPNPATHGASAPGTIGGGEATICCTSSTIINCQTEQSEGVFSPARRLVVLSLGTGPVSVDIFSDADCRTFDRTISAVLSFPQSDLWGVNVDFTPPLRTGTQLSLKWSAGYCDQTPCINYTLGSTPGGCWPEYYGDGGFFPSGASCP